MIPNRSLGLTLLLSLAVVGASCTSESDPTTTSVMPTTTATTMPATTATTTLPPTTTTTSSAPPLVAKAPLAGLVDRADVPPDEFVGIVDAYVVDVAWSDLQSKGAGDLEPNNPIDRAIKRVREFNDENAEDLSIKLRIRAGIDAPDWAKSLAGSPIEITDPQDEVAGTIGAFWTEEFGAAYDMLQVALAAAYDDVPEIREVTISRCTTVYVEPFNRNIKDEASVEALLDAEFDAGADVNCLTDQIDSHDVWEQTRSGLALNPYQVIESDGATRVDLDVTLSVMSYCRSVLGERCVLENNSIRWPPLEGRPGKMYDEMERLGPPYSFQTAAPARVGDLGKALQWAVDRGACAVELPRGYGDMLEAGVLDGYASQLAANDGCA